MDLHRIATVVFLSLPGVSSAVDLYDLTDLGVITTASLSESQNLKLDINSSGSVVGWTRSTPHRSSPIKAFVWEPGTGRQSIDSSTNADAALAINDNQQIVGWTEQAGQPQAVLWQFNGGSWVENIIAMPNVKSSEAKDIDNAGNIVGNSIDNNDLVRGFFWTATPLQAHLLNNDASTLSLVSGLASGRAAGAMAIAPNQTRAALIRGSNDVINLGSLHTTGAYSKADAMNTSEIVVGGSLTDNVPCTKLCFTVSHGFIWEDATGMQDLMPNDLASSWANDINDAGLVVGWRLDLPTSIAVLWQARSAMNLNLLVPNNANWKLERAHAINDAGQIVGLGTFNGEARAFLLTPNGATAASSDLAFAEISLPSNKLSSRQSLHSARFSVRNNGPDVATNVVVSSTLLPALSVEAVTLSKGNCSIQGELTCTIDRLDVNETIEVEATYAATASGVYDIVFTTESDGIDGGVFDNDRLEVSLNLDVAAPASINEDPSVAAEDDAVINDDQAAAAAFSLWSAGLFLMLSVFRKVRRRYPVKSA